MNGRQWRLSRDVVALVTTEVGLTDLGIAEELGVTVAELRPVIGMLIGRRKLVRCDEYLTVPQTPGPAS